jgi:phage gpG-like protein
MPNPITVSWDDAAVNAALARVRQKTDPLAPLLKIIGEDLVESTKRCFNTATDPNGTPWAANSPVTIRRYLGLKQGNTQQDGSLSKKGVAVQGRKKPLTGETEALKKEIFYRVVGNNLEVGSTVEYSAAQQFGAKKGSLSPHAPWGDIPARPFLGISAADSGAIDRSILDYLKIS